MRRSILEKLSVIFSSSNYMPLYEEKKKKKVVPVACLSVFLSSLDALFRLPLANQAAQFGK